MKTKKLTFAENLELVNELVKTYEIGVINIIDLYIAIGKIKWATRKEKAYIISTFESCLNINVNLFKNCIK